MLTSLSASSALANCKIFVHRTSNAVVSNGPISSDLEKMYNELNEYDAKYQEELEENLQLLGYDLADSVHGAKYEASLSTSHDSAITFIGQFGYRLYDYTKDSDWKEFRLAIRNRETGKTVDIASRSPFAYLAFNSLMNTIKDCQ